MKKMYYILIILGIALVTIGIVGLSKEKGNRSLEAEKVGKQSSAAENGSTSGSLDSKDNSQTLDTDREEGNERYDDGGAALGVNSLLG